MLQGKGEIVLAWQDASQCFKRVLEAAQSRDICTPDSSPFFYPFRPMDQLRK